jgi:hypothetical protein
MKFSLFFCINKFLYCGTERELSVFVCNLLYLLDELLYAEKQITERELSDPLPNLIFSVVAMTKKKLFIFSDSFVESISRLMSQLDV